MKIINLAKCKNKYNSYDDDNTLASFIREF